MYIEYTPSKHDSGTKAHAVYIHTCIHTYMLHVKIITKCFSKLIMVIHDGPKKELYIYI